MDNYEVAVETAEKCCQANTQFAEISEVNSGGSEAGLSQSDAHYSATLRVHSPRELLSQADIVNSVLCSPPTTCSVMIKSLRALLLQSRPSPHSLDQYIY